jgi:hypothetical protein
MQMAGKRGKWQARSPPARRAGDLTDRRASWRDRYPVSGRASSTRNRNWADGGHRQPRSDQQPARDNVKGSRGMTQRTSHLRRYKGLASCPALCRLHLQRNRAIAGEPAAIPVRAEGRVTR